MYLRLVMVTFVFMLVSCSNDKTSGWNYNNPSNSCFEIQDTTVPATGWDTLVNGGFQKVPYYNDGQEGGLILVEGGNFAMGDSVE